MKPNKVSIIVLIVVMSMAIIGAVLVSTLAIWTESYEDDKTVEIPVSEYNPSEKHIIFVPLDELGLIISDKSFAISYAAVGYTGLVGELEIPATHHPAGYEEKQVTAILIDQEYINEAFAGNEIVTSIIMPFSITRIGAGVFANMENVTSIIIKDDDPPAGAPQNLYVGDYAFSYTTSLTSFTYAGHSFIGSFETAFFGSSYVP
ncbi:MAG: hypothetical protein EOM87_07580 [Clostridia bacterium]|nr:hypothetical protein [Clostridia bacterium]